jgi:excinuclease UvrABC ATPase subunit
MAMSSCPHCKGHTFEVQENSPQKSTFKQMFIQCTACGTVVGVTEYFNVGSLVTDQQKAIDGLAKRLGSIEHAINQIIHVLNSRP